MKRLFLLLALCCVAVACEQTPDYLRADIEKNVSDGWYRYAGTQGVKYTNGVANGFETLYGWAGINSATYYKIEDMQLTGYRHAECSRCGTKAAFTFSISYDLKNNIIEGDEILKFNEDEIVLIEPMLEAIERCKNDKDFWRSYKVYTRQTPNNELLTAFENASNSTEESSQFILTHISCKK